MSATKEEFEFGLWRTPFSDGEVAIREVRWNQRSRQVDTLVELLDDHVAGSRHTVSFQRVRAFRVLDEGGLMELWCTSQRRPNQTTFRVRGHGWSRESPTEFFMGTHDGWSFVIATDWDCIEVLTTCDPIIGPVHTFDAGETTHDS